MPWLALTVRLAAEKGEALGDALLDGGAQSVSIDPEEGSLTALLADDADAVAVLRAAAGRAALVPAPPFTVARVEDEDWVRRSQEQFAALELGRLWIGPSWHEPPQGLTAVRLDPGLAFGTGSHPSTRLALEFLERHLRGGESVLDYGCGSGILAIVACKLGAAPVDAVDLDARALEATAANAAANRVRLSALAPEALPARCYDVVVANILAQPLIVLAPLLASRTAPAGRLALSGILATQAGEVARAYAGHFRMSAATDEGWALLEGVRR